jgi:ribonuclease PH
MDPNDPNSPIARLLRASQAQGEDAHRRDSRGPSMIRPVKMIPNFHKPSEGSVLYQAGNTVVLCTASIDEKVPGFLEGKNKGWLTAEYQMHPRAGGRRQDRDGRGSKGLGGRSHEIQRLIGRALRSCLDLEALGPRTITIDCDVLEADGGTRTASITGGFVALAFALERLTAKEVLTTRVLKHRVAAISVGRVKGRILADLVYEEDSKADFDLNVVANAHGEIIEIQGTAEGPTIPRKELDQMIDLALEHTHALCRIQNTFLGMNGASLQDLIILKPEVQA